MALRRRPKVRESRPTSGGVAATLLLRLLLCFVDGEHNLALRARFGGVNRSTKLSTFWFDVRSNSGTVQAAVVLVAL